MSLKKVTCEKRRSNWFSGTPGQGDGKRGIGFWGASAIWALQEDAGKCSSVSTHLHQQSSQDSGSCTWLIIAPRSVPQYQVWEYSDALKWCLTLCDPIVCIPSGSSIYGISQTRILEWVAISFPWGSSQPKDPTWVPCIAGSLYHWATGKTDAYFKASLDLETNKMKSPTSIYAGVFCLSLSLGQSLLRYNGSGIWDRTASRETN